MLRGGSVHAPSSDSKPYFWPREVNMFRCLSGAIFVLFLATGCDQDAANKALLEQSKPLMQDIETQVAADAVRQYRIVQRSSRGDQQSEIQLHVQAGLAAAAYLQAEDETNYRHWNEVAAEHQSKALELGQQ